LLLNNEILTAIMVKVLCERLFGDEILDVLARLDEDSDENF
jgi:hypothetical protein